MKAKEKSMPKFEDKQDPQEGLMSLMKKMYEDGDDEKLVHSECGFWN